MDQVFQYEIPVLHPLLVHFPVVLILLSACFALVWAVRNTNGALLSAVAIQCLAVLATTLSYLTGEEMEERGEGVPIVDMLAGIHEQAALATLILSTLTLIFLLGALFMKRRGMIHSGSHRPLRMLIIVLGITSIAAVLWTAHIGGTMVWGTVRL
jgi:uncharacterized membrane protein